MLDPGTSQDGRAHTFRVTSGALSTCLAMTFQGTVLQGYNAPSSLPLSSPFSHQVRFFVLCSLTAQRSVATCLMNKYEDLLLLFVLLCCLLFLNP